MLREGSLFLDALQVGHERHVALTIRKVASIPLKYDHVAAVAQIQPTEINEDRQTDEQFIVQMQPPHSGNEVAVLESVEFNMVTVPAVVSLHYLRMWERANLVRRYGVDRLKEGISLTLRERSRRRPDFYCHGFLTSSRFRLITLRLFSKMKTKVVTAAKTLKARWTAIMFEDYGTKYSYQQTANNTPAGDTTGEVDKGPPPLTTCIPLSLLNKEGVFPVPNPRVALNAALTLLRLEGSLELDVIVHDDGRLPAANAAPANVNTSRVNTMVAHQKARQVPTNTTTCKIVTMEYLLMKQSVMPHFPCVLSAIRSLIDLGHNLLKFIFDQFKESSSLQVLCICNDRVQDFDRDVLHPRFPNGMVQTNDYNDAPTVSMCLSRGTAVTAAMKELLKHEAYVALFYRHFADNFVSWYQNESLIAKWKKERSVLFGKTIRLYSVPTITTVDRGPHVESTYASHLYNIYGLSFTFGPTGLLPSEGVLLERPEMPIAPQSALHAVYVAFHERSSVSGFSGATTDVTHIVSTQPLTVIACLQQCGPGLRPASHKSQVFVSLPGVYTLDVTGEMHDQVNNNNMALPNRQIGASIAGLEGAIIEPLAHDMQGLRHAQMVMLFLMCANDDSPKIAPLTEQHTMEGWLLYCKEMALYANSDVALYRENICLVRAVPRTGEGYVMEGNFVAVLRFVTFLYLRLNVAILEQTSEYKHLLFEDGNNSGYTLKAPHVIVEEVFDQPGYRMRGLLLNDSRSFPPLEVLLFVLLLFL